MVKSSTKKVVIDKPSMARDIPTSLCDLPQAVRDGIVNEVAATKDVVEMEIGSSTAEKVANMASQPGSSGTVGSKKRKWGFGVDPTGGVLTKGTHSLTSSPDNAPTSGRLKPMRFMSKSKAKAAPTISNQNMGKHDEASSQPATHIIVSPSTAPLPSVAAVVLPPPGTAFNHLASACQEVLFSAKAASTEVNRLIAELTATNEKLSKLKEELTTANTNNESLRLLIKENSEMHQEGQKALAEEKSKREALYAGLKENFFAFNEVAKQLGRGVQPPPHFDDVSLLASIGELVGEMEKVPADIIQKADWDTRIALKTGACHTLACISSKHPELDLNKEVHEGVAEEEREKLMDQLEKTGEAVASFYLD
ncbi:uncharacterized protein [Oryza sativa Japonica Group]|uniref:Uncharacterized protein n=1 Tax=Oryza sativa subsp. japonica TaxID=39947 RepID=B9F4T0_ORYSJ|nr:hypothetical protein OsJ_06081 [Oryza sativa Japonica Group]